MRFIMVASVAYIWTVRRSRGYHGPPARWVLACAAATLVSLTGCSDSDRIGKAPSSAATQAAPSPVPPTTLPPGAVGVSSTGVTTRVDAPADSTEEEYFQACHAAKLWMDVQRTSGESLIESYLAVIQASQSGTPGSWNIRWVDLTPARQAAVITAARAAADAQCG